MIDDVHRYTEGIDLSVRSAYRSYLIRRRTALLLLPAAVLLGGFALLYGLESTAWLGPLVKSFITLATVATAIVVLLALYRKLPVPGYREYYNRASRAAGIEPLRNLLDLAGDAAPRPAAGKFREAAIRQNTEWLKDVDIAGKLSGYNKSGLPAAWLSYGMWALLLPLVVLPVLIHLHPDALKRSLVFWEAFERPNPFTFVIEPGDSVLEQGASFRVQIRFEGDPLPEGVHLALRTGIEDRFRPQRMQQTGAGMFVSGAIELFNDIDYYVEMDGFKSQVHRLEVQLLPRFSELAVTLEPPSYTGLGTTRISYPFSRIEAYPGSRLTISGRPNKPIEEALLISSRADTLSACEATAPTGLDSAADSAVAPQADPGRQADRARTDQGTGRASARVSDAATGTLEWVYEVSGNDTLSFSLTDRYGLANSNPFGFTLAALTDMTPVARILEPAREKSVLEPGSLEIIYEVEDDFGFTGLRLHYTLTRSFGRDQQSGQVRLATPRDRIHLGRYTWDLSGFRLQPLDVIEYRIEVTDNDEVSGFKTGRSATHILRSASLAEYLLDQEEKEQSVGDALDRARSEFDEMQRELDELRRNLIENRDDNWQNQRMLEDIQDRSSGLSEQLEEIQREFEDLRRDLEDNHMLSEETLQKYNELQNLLQEIDDPELRRALEELQRSLESMDQNQLREAMQNLQFNEQTYRERLERTIELFKDLRLTADMEKTVRLLEELSRQEERLMQEITDPDEQISQQQMIRDELDQVRELLDKLPDVGPDRRRDMTEQLRDDVGGDLDQVSEQLEQNMQDIRDGAGEQQIRDSQDQIRQRLQQLSDDVRSSMQSMQQQQININVTALQTILQNLILLSEAQEGVNASVGRLSDASAGFIEQARRQSNITRSFSLVSDSLFRVSAEIPQFSNRINEKKAEVMRNLDRTVGFQAERDRSRSSAQGRMSLGGINELAVMVADLLEQIQDNDGSGGGGGMSAQQMLQRMQQMGRDQQQLNQMIQNFINDMAGERLSQDQMQRLDQMARQQNQIRRQLQQMREGGGLRPGDPMMSEIQRMLEQMEDTINDLRGGSTDRILVQRQQNILSRMLEAERALQERGEDEERRGETVTDFERRTPDDMTLEELQQRIRSTLQDPNRTRFSQDYQRLIERYFELLQEQFGRELPSD